MRLGLVARMDNSGLGTQTFEFYRHMQPAKTMVVDISRYNNNKQYPERYGDNPIGIVTFISGFPMPAQIDEFLKDLDVVFVAEAPYNYYLYERARELGIKTAVQYNYEFFDWFANPNYPKPDMLIAPSSWHYLEVQQWCNDNGVKHTYLHCPVNRSLLPERTIKQARTFLHMAGRAAAHDRNGTLTVIESAKYLETDAKIFVHFQGEQGLPHQATNSFEDYYSLFTKVGNKNLTMQQWEYENYNDIYNGADVLLLPRRYGGNCLPMNEALSVGMPVVMTDISPNRGFLPYNWLIPAEVVGMFMPRTEVTIYGSDPSALAAKIDELYNLSEEAMLVENDRAKSLAASISWDTMQPQYVDALESLCTPF